MFFCSIWNWVEIAFGLSDQIEIVVLLLRSWSDLEHEGIKLSLQDEEGDMAYYIAVDIEYP